jgi:molybdopterin synthase sulfur carrier subunit
MNVQVRLFAVFRELVGAETIELPASQAQTVGEIWGRLLVRCPELNHHVPSAAINATYASLNDRVEAGDEVAFLPPVSGG